MISLAYGLQARDSLPAAGIMVATTLEYDAEDGLRGTAKFQISGVLVDMIKEEAGAEGESYFRQFISQRFAGWQVDDVQVSQKGNAQAPLIISARISHKELVKQETNASRIPANLGYRPFVLAGKKLQPAIYTEYLLFQTGYPDDVKRVKMPQRQQEQGDGQDCSFSFEPASGGQNFSAKYTIKFNSQSDQCSSMLSSAYTATGNAWFEIVMDDQ